jgi:hypothetical protein
MVDREMRREMANRSDQEPETHGLSDEDIRRKAAAFQSRRPQMKGLKEQDKMIPGGRAAHRGPAVTPSFDTDDSFVKASSRADQDTPVANYEGDMSGEALLEQYYVDEAATFRPPTNNKPWRRPTMPQ